MKITVLIFLWLYSCLSVAGGDYARGRIVEFSSTVDSYNFKFEQYNKGAELLKGCRIFSVQVSYVRVPWHSWLTYVHTTHPTKKQTEAAGELIINSYHQQKELYFGYIGGGLVPDKKSCAFISKGLLLEDRGESIPTVLSFYHPV